MSILLTAHYNYISFLVQPFVFPGVQVVLLFLQICIVLRKDANYFPHSPVREIGSILFFLGDIASEVFHFPNLNLEIQISTV
jgi:hypothetical protein